MAVGSRVAPRDAPRALRLSLPHEPLILGTLGVVLFLAGWELAALHGWLNPVILSSPSRIAAAFAAQAASGQFFRDLSVSLLELVIGFGLSIVFGFALGLAMGLNRTVEYAFDPFVWFLYSTPLVALYPLLVVWLGFGFTTVVAITFLLTVVTIVVNTMAGVRSVDPTIVRAVRAFGGKPLDVVRLAIVPASLPLVMGGIRIGLSRALIGVVLGEMFSSNAGLGFRMTVYGARLQAADVFVPLMAFVVIGLILNQCALALEARFQRWKS